MISEAVADLFDVITKRAGWFDDSRWWSSNSFIRTKAGPVITEATAETLSAVWCATRVISEGLASLPLNLREHVDDRTTRTAYEHRLWALLHDQPNSEQDSFGWRDTMAQWQVNWGDGYSEKQRDASGEVVALWPIHPSRVKISRDDNQTTSTSAGDPGELIYWVNNNDGSWTRIPARDMLHLPGVMSANGINGKSHIRWAAEALGIVSATEQHVGSFFENGASPGFAVIVKGNIPKEEKENLRASWREKIAGSKNAHKDVLLFGDSDVKPLGINPDEAQLLEARKFGVEEVSRFWRVPKHFLSSMENATFNNIELLNLNFLTYTLTPWIIRWELALKRQLLEGADRQRYSFKFNLNALMRGDSQSRSQFYMRLFDMGVLSPNMIAELEDLNPVDGGDRHFIQANNRVPLDRIDDIALLQGKAQADPNEPSDGPEDSVTKTTLAEAAKSVLTSTLTGLIGYESRQAVRAAANPREFETWCNQFYSGKFTATFSSQVGPLLSGAKSLGVVVSGEEFTGRHVERSKTELLSLLDQPFSNFAGAVQSTVDGWECRALEESASAFVQGSENVHR